LQNNGGNAMDSEEVHAILQCYGVAGLLTAQDNPVFGQSCCFIFSPVKELI